MFGSVFRIFVHKIFHFGIYSVSDFCNYLYICGMENQMKKKINPLNWKTALSASFIMSLSIVAIGATFSMIFDDLPVGLELNVDTLLRVGRILLGTTLVLFLLYLFAFKAVQLPVKPRVKNFIVIMGTFLLIAGITFLTRTILFALKGDFEPREYAIIFHLISGMIITVVIWITTMQLYLNNLQQDMMLENERLIAENIRNRYDALKSQIDPHFLFNSLNTLNGLIGFDNARAHKYVEKMSLVFRYTIQNKEVTTLKEEIDFANSYAYLIKIRYGDNFQVETDIAERYLSYNIMPISIQHLLENAIKHNVISSKYPLTVRIYTTETDMLVVENDIQTKEFAPASLGTGLANLCERYHLLFHKEVIISNLDNVFRVEIPIIKNASQTCDFLKTNNV